MTLSRAAARPGGRPMPAPVSPLGRLGGWSYRHRRAVAAAWLLILVLVSVAGRAAGSRFKDDLNAGTATQSQQGIDYALFVVTRYRGALRSGADPHAAVITAMATSGRAVVFAGSTVVLSLLGLFLLGLPFIYGAALGAIIAVLLVMTVSVTLLPAALGFVGTGVDRLRVGRRPRADQAPGDERGFRWRWSRRGGLRRGHPGPGLDRPRHHLGGGHHDLRLRRVRAR
jgi:uncharacterized membrane protein YdfJ with MMPL/SSD domain